MRTIGIVAEYNPFHGGHAHHIRRTRDLAGDCAVVAVMSGNFVQRGDCALTDKWSRARAAVEGGVDLVLELPTLWAASSAEHFAGGAAALLQDIGVDTLSFGSESGDDAPLRACAQALDSPAFQAALREQLSQGLPFALCRQRAAEALLGPQGAAPLARPNDNLGVEYLRAAGRLDFHPQVITVRRVGAGHDGGDDPRYPSASHLRSQVWAGQRQADNPAALAVNQRGVLTLLRRMTAEDFAALPDCGEGLSQRLERCARQAVSLEQLYTLAKTKRYAHARIRRAVLWAALGLRQDMRPARPPYLRVLAFNQTGRQLLRSYAGPRPLITKPTHGKGIPLLELEARCTDFYALCRTHPTPAGAEWRTSPVVL